MPTPQSYQPNFDFTPEIQAFLQRAQAGDITVLPELRTFLDERADVWQAAGDLAHHAKETFLAFATKSDLLARESIQRKMADLHTTLAGDNCSPLVNLLIERIVLVWAQLCRTAWPRGSRRQTIRRFRRS